MHIPGRKYEVTLPDGRIVSRQRADQLRNPEKHAERNSRWKVSESGKASRRRTNKKYSNKES